MEIFFLSREFFFDIRQRFLINTKSYIFNPYQTLQYIYTENLNCTLEIISICSNFVLELCRKQEGMLVGIRIFSPCGKYTQSVKYGYTVFDIEIPP